MINTPKEDTLFNMTRSGSLLCCLTLLYFVGNCNAAFAAEPGPAKAHNPENPFAYCSRVVTADLPAGGTRRCRPLLLPIWREPLACKPTWNSRRRVITGAAWMARYTYAPSAPIFLAMPKRISPSGIKVPKTTAGKIAKPHSYRLMQRAMTPSTSGLAQMAVRCGASAQLRSIAAAIAL